MGGSADLATIQNEDTRFRDRVAVVTGGGHGIGRAVALRLARGGAHVLVVDLDEAKARGTAAAIGSIGGSAHSIRADVTDAADVRAAAGEVLAGRGRVDILVNCAGGGWRSPSVFVDVPEDSWRWVLDLNINGTLLFTHALLRPMVERRYGKIINLASIAAWSGLPKNAVYAATKGAIVAFTKSLAMEVAAHGVNVNSVSPGMIAETEPPPPTNGTFLGRHGTADEVASVVAFLASDEAAFVTGADYLVDGGRTLGPRGA